MPTSLSELYVHPVFQSKTQSLIQAKLLELNQGPAELGPVVIVRDNVGRVEGTTSITATFTVTVGTESYAGELAITTEQVWQEFSTDDLADQSEIEILELEKA